MPKILEGKMCHWFPDKECIFPIPKETLELLMQDPDVADIGETPSMESPTCTNCLLKQIIEAINDE